VADRRQVAGLAQGLGHVGRAGDETGIPAIHGGTLLLAVGATIGIRPPPGHF
jgi:hypothetical protein